MPAPLSPGDAVQTPLGKGVVSAIRHGGRVVVLIASRAVVVDGRQVTRIEPARKASRQKPATIEPEAERRDGVEPRHAAPAEVDLHGLTVAEAIARVASAINDAILDGRLQLRVIHGRSGGRIKAALHRELRSMPPVRAFRLDSTNDGVTILEL